MAIFPLRVTATRIASFSQTTMRYLMRLDSAVFSCVAGNYRFRLVGRAEVKNDEFKFAKGLVEDGFDRLREKAINVVHHHHD